MSASAAPTHIRFSSAAPPSAAALRRPRRRCATPVRCSLAAAPGLRAPPELIDSILSKVKGTDRGVLLPKDGHQEVADVALQLAKYCIDDPVKSPLIFGEWEVVYCSVPTSPGGLYRTPLGRLIFKTDEMAQVVQAPDVVKNKVSFSVFGFDGAVSLKGKLNVLDGKWIQVIFEPPEVKRAMPMRVLTVGKKRSRGAQLIVEEYKEKLGYYCDIEDTLIKSNPKLTSDVKVQVEAEDMAMMLQLKPEDFVVVLDENGKDVTSEQVADLVGDAGNTVRERADATIRLSSMVLNHQVALIVLMEQLYRAWTIIKGQKYHH
uniref:Plastid lipid-associated protein/fibrillin conserved domain-containing protein n=1 Tax=Oryza nivara TaxID=4536 RepID=A0A0E0H5P7_ORYNI